MSIDRPSLIEPSWRVDDSSPKGLESVEELLLYLALYVLSFLLFGLIVLSAFWLWVLFIKWAVGL